MKLFYRKLFSLLLLTLTLVVSLSPGAPPLFAQDGSVSGSIGNPDDAYLEFTLTGADLKLREGTTNHYDGPWTGGPITLSGKMIVKRESDPIIGGTVSYVRFFGYLHDQNNRFKWPEDEEMRLVQDRVETQEATITYTIPDGYDQPTVQGHIAIEVCGQNCGKYEFFFHIDVTAEYQEPEPPPSSTPDDCIWQLKKGMPETSISPAYEAVTILSEPPSIHISAQGLNITHTWTPFPSTLIPSEEFDLEITASWQADRSEPFDTPCDIKTSLVYNTWENIEIGKGSIDLNLEPTGYLSEPFAYQVPTGHLFKELTFIITAETSLGIGTARYTYTCENAVPIEPIELEYGRWKTGVKTGFVDVYYPMGKDQDGNYIYNYDDPHFVKEDMELPVGAKLITSDHDSSVVEILDTVTKSNITIKPATEVDLIGGLRPHSGYITIWLGTLKMNIGKVLRGEEIEAKTNLATVGVKGTELILEVKPDRTTLKMIEGVAAFTAHANSQTISVYAGDQVSADETGFSNISTFDIDAELSTWPSDDDLDFSGNTIQRLLPGFFKNPPLWVGIVILLFGLAGVGLFAFLVFIRAINRNEDKNQTSKAVRLVLLAVLLSVSCLVSLCGVGGLYRNLSQSRASGTQIAPHSELAAMAQTEAALGLEQTQISFALQGTTAAQLTDIPPTVGDSTEPNTRTTSAIQETGEVPEPTAQLASPDEPLTGGQHLTDNGFVDDFSSDAMGWQVKDDGVTILRYENAAYRLIMQEKRGFDFVYFPVEFHPKEILFDIQAPYNAHEGTFGVICQLQDAENYYYIDFDFQSGQYAIQQVLNGELVPLTVGADYWIPTTAFNQPTTAFNRIYISCYLDDIQLNINDKVVDIVFIEKPFTKTGRAAFFLFTYEYMSDPNFQVLIDNVEAYDPVQ